MWRMFSPRRVSRKKLLLALIIGFYLFITEVLVYYVQSFRWPSLPSTGAKADELKVLFVADPQLLGHMEGTITSFGFLTRWDSDRFLAKTYNLAHSYVKPDVVIFLGDLLNDGSIATDERFREYVDRFYGIFQKAKGSKVIYLHGDNDVGGLEEDMKTVANVKRFEKYFEPAAGVVSDGTIDFIKINYDFPDKYTDEKLMELTRIAGEMNKRHFKIIINHHSVLMRATFQVKPVLDMIVPNLFFTAHEHTSHIIECRDCYNGKKNRGGFAKREDPVTIDMNDLKRLREIVVPTCNYRMGVSETGYGVAVINRKSGIVKYTVLWLPHRFTVLKSYFFFLISILFCVAAYFFYIEMTTSRPVRWEARLKSTKFYA